jgi:hypothetical protein
VGTAILASPPMNDETEVIVPVKAGAIQREAVKAPKNVI